MSSKARALHPAGIGGLA